MSKYKTILASSITFFLGITCARFNNLPTLIICLVGLFVYGYYLLKANNLPRVSFVVFVLIFSFLVGYLRFLTTVPITEYYFGQYVSIEGIISDDVDVRESLKLITLKPENYSSKILVQYRGSSNFFYGDKVWVQGMLEKPESFKGFDYPHYLESKSIHAVLKTNQLIVLKQKQGNFIKTKIFTFKAWVSKKIEENIPAPENQVVLGMLIGARKNIPLEITQAFQKSGTSHILAVSGFNITIIISLFGNLLSSFLSRKKSFIFTTLAIIFFSILTGGSASVIRAGLMGLLFVIAKASSRQYAQVGAIVITGAIMVFLNPLILFYDPGFQLSFLATIGLVVLVPRIEKLMPVLAKNNFTRAYAIPSLAATLATLPLTFKYFGYINVLSIFANVLVLPVVPTVMAAGGLSLLPGIGSGFGFVAMLLVKYIVLILKLFSSQDWAIISV